MDSEASQSPAKKNLFRSSAIVGLMTMVSRFLGLARDVVVANFFGASAGADAFFVAFKIPNFFRRLFAEGAFSQAFIPVLADYKDGQDRDAVRTLLGSVLGVLGAVLFVFSLLAVLGAPWVTALFAPGFLDEPAKYELASTMLQITFPYLFLISLTAFAGAVLNSYGNFAVPAFTPVLLNLSLIASAVFLTPLFAQPVIALAWGVFIAGVLQLFFQLPFLLRLGLLPRPILDYRHEGVRKIGALMLPAMFGVSVSQINLLLDTILASLLQTGSVSWLYYSDRLVELPLGVFGIAIATVILPALSANNAAKSEEAFSATIDWALKMVLLIGLPAALALIVLAEPLIAVLFHYGALNDTDVLQSAHSLRAYALGLLAFMFVKVLAPGFFARKDMRTPVKIGIYAMIANMVFNLALIWPLQHAGLALATAMSAWLNAICLLVVLKRQGVYKSGNGWFVFVIRLLGAVVAMVLVVSYLNSPTQEWLVWDVWQRISTIGLLVICGIFSYFIVLLCLGLNLKNMLKQKV
ncbi:MAG: murein biosynthesis integral membrane protein MurJ [Oleiphilaceae bacterium]|nr:murein biosynthesis integral membrane protein MurJ [Oleiphilaceae bacterium]